MPDLIRHPDVVPTKVRNPLKDWVPVSTGNPGFRLSPERRLSLNQAIYGQTLFNFGLQNVDFGGFGFELKTISHSEICIPKYG